LREFIAARVVEPNDSVSRVECCVMPKGNKQGHRRFGNVRCLPSGCYQASYIGPGGRRHNAPKTFECKTDAERWLTLTEAQIFNGDWTDPERAKVELGVYAAKWIEQRPGLRPRTVELYRWLLRKHIAPYLGGVALGKLSTSMIREWRAKLLDSGVSASVTAKAYRLLRAVLMTAMEEDKILPRNPCRVRGAGTEDAPERPTLSVAQVFELAERARYCEYAVTVRSNRVCGRLRVRGRQWTNGDRCGRYRFVGGRLGSSRQDRISSPSTALISKRFRRLSKD
jgi:hypothetical protein